MTSLTPSDWWEEPTLFAEDSPAKTYPSQASEQDLQGNVPASSGMHLLSRRMSKRDGSSWRTSPGCLRQIRDAISEQSSLHWTTQGFLTSNGKCWIRSSSECPNVAVASSLSQVLLTQVDDRYLLSAKAASGILRRTEGRGKPLPEALRMALEQVVELSHSTGRTGGGYGNANPGLGITEDGTGPLSTSQVPAVAVDFRHTTLNAEVTPTLQAKSTGGVSLNYLPGVLEVRHGSVDEVAQGHEPRGLRDMEAGGGCPPR